MSNVPSELKYTKSHEWVRDEGDGSVTIGITEHAQELLGDMVFVEMPEVERELAAAEDCAVVESVKAASDVYSPIAGTVTAANDALADAPELVNSDPFGDGWLWRMSVADAAELDGLLDADAYQAIIDEDA